MSSLLGSLASSVGSAGSSIGSGLSSAASSVGSGLSSAGSAIGNGLSSVGNATLSGLESAGNAVVDGASWLGNQASSFGDWITTAENWKGPIWGDSSAEVAKDTTTNTSMPNSQNDMIRKFVEAEQKRREEMKRQQRLNAAYGLLQQGLQQMNRNNNNPYAWRAY